MMPALGMTPQVDELAAAAAFWLRRDPDQHPCAGQGRTLSRRRGPSRSTFTMAQYADRNVPSHDLIGFVRAPLAAFRPRVCGGNSAKRCPQLVPSNDPLIRQIRAIRP